MMTYHWRIECPALLLLMTMVLVQHQVDSFLLPSPTRVAFCAVNRKTPSMTNQHQQQHPVAHQLSSTTAAEVDQGRQILHHEQSTATPTVDDDLLLREHPQYQPSVLRGSVSGHASEWQKALLPSQPWQKPGAVVDVTVQWKPSREDPRDVAQRLLEQTTGRRLVAGGGSRLSLCLVDDLEVSLRQFAEFCGRHYRHYDDSPSRLTIKARLVATRGAPGTKCPQWHVDHLPVRWIQALVGPGCQWIEDNDNISNDENSSGIQWDRINALNENDDDDDDDDELVLDDPDDRNRFLIDPQRAVIRQAKPGEAVLLLGQEWPTNGGVAGEVAMRRRRVRPAVHKSPEIKALKPRVLLTMDIVAVEDEGEWR